MAQICVFGSANCDLMVTVESFPMPGMTITSSSPQRSTGGKSANQAVAAGRLGADVCFCGVVGVDDAGDAIAESLEAAHVDISALERCADATTGTAIIVVDGRAENMIMVSRGANDRVDSRYAQRCASMIADAHFLGLTGEVPRSGLETAALIAQESGTCVVFNPSPFSAMTPRILSLTDILLLNEHELFLLLDKQVSIEEIGKSLDDLSLATVRCVVVTLGKRGALVWERSSSQGEVKGVSTFVATPTVDVVDTTGCGDAFAGAFMAALSQGSSYVEATRQACRVAAFAAKGAGAQDSYPWGEEVLSLPLPEVERYS